MLRITTQAEPARVTLRLEGELTGIWVSELSDAWRATLPALGSRALYIDLSAVGRVDKAGEYLLALVRSTGRTQLVGSGIITLELIGRISHDWPVANPNANKEA